MKKTSKKAPSKSATKKKAPAKAAKPKKGRVGRPPGSVGQLPGGTKTRAALRRMAKVLMAEVDGKPDTEAAEFLGIEPHDMKNLRADNLPGLLLLLRFVRNGRFSPAALILEGKVRKLAKGFSTAAATQEAITRRVRDLAGEKGATEWASETGLSAAHVYQLRSAKTAGVRTVVAFVLAGVSADAIFFGKN